MSFSRKSPLETKTWKKIVAHYEQIKWVHLKEMFDYNPSREKEMSFSWGDFFVDFSKNRWDKDTLNLFNEFADELNLKESISTYFEENKLNFTENRAVLHTALRSGKKEIILS